MDDLIAAGAVAVPPVDRHDFSLDGLLEVTRTSEGGRMVGKPVLEVTPGAVRP